MHGIDVPWAKTVNGPKGYCDFVKAYKPWNDAIQPGSFAVLVAYEKSPGEVVCQTSYNFNTCESDGACQTHVVHDTHLWTVKDGKISHHIPVSGGFEIYKTLKV